jgi:hypothetical protein
VRRAEIRPFAEIGFAKDNCTGRAQLRDDRRVLQRYRARQRVRSRGRRHPICRIDIVLHQDRNAMQRPAHLAGLPLTIQRRRYRERVGVGFDHVPQRRPDAIQLVDPIDVVLRD